MYNPYKDIFRNGVNEKSLNKAVDLAKKVNRIHIKWQWKMKAIMDDPYMSWEQAESAIEKEFIASLLRIPMNFENNLICAVNVTA